VRLFIIYHSFHFIYKKGDLIDVLDMNESGIWTGILNSKMGTFKFINVDLIGNNHSTPMPNANANASPLSANTVVHLQKNQNVNLMRTGNAETKPSRLLQQQQQQHQPRFGMPKSTTYCSLFKKSMYNSGELCNSDNNSIRNLNAFKCTPISQLLLKHKLKVS